MSCEKCDEVMASRVTCGRLLFKHNVFVDGVVVEETASTAFQSFAIVKSGVRDKRVK
jgi:hypothetical protein